jgi:glucosyl-dolichyl phosphate glucuronosyltransferase
MEISVILCTYNRSELLQKALESLAESQLPAELQWEVLVIDNNSKDSTRRVVEEFCRRHPGRFRYLLERQQGKSFALNTGLREAKGEILAFVDDDVTVDPQWLQTLTVNLRSSKWTGSGGRILPERNFVRPRWYPPDARQASAPLALFDLGNEPGPLDTSPYGTNMAFRREVFERNGCFRTDLGPRPGTEIRGEDTEFGSRVLSAGEPLRYEPSAVVYHAIPEHRLQRGYFLNWWFDKGRSNIREFGPEHDTGWSVAGVPLRFVRRFASWTLRWMFSFDPAVRFSSKLNVWLNAGHIQECRLQPRKS